jgi:tRNA (guanine-N7-)-methyltransferase
MSPLILERKKNADSIGKIEFTPSPRTAPLDWDRLFGREAPVEIEVGCGKGRFLLERSALFPGRNFIGLEYARAYLETIAKRATSRGLDNVRVSKTEAAEFFWVWVPDRSVSAFHLLYPDPWPKKRHHKRRLIQHDFLRELRRVLLPGGEINIATDHSDYYHWMVDHFEKWKGTFVLEYKVLTDPEERAVFQGRTNYEIKYLAEGRPIHLIRGVRTGF